MIFMSYSYWQIESTTINGMHLLVYDKDKRESFEVTNGVILTQV